MTHRFPLLNINSEGLESSGVSCMVQIDSKASDDSLLL